MFRAYLVKILRSPLIYLCIVGIAAVFALQPIEQYCQLKLLPFLDIEKMFSYVRDIGYNKDIVTVLGALPFVANFASEWQTGVTTQCVTRCGTKKYITANIAFCALSTLVTVMLGLLLFVFVFSFVMPLYVPDGNLISPYCHNLILITGHPFLYLLSNIFVFALSIAMYSVMGLTISAIFPNKYVAIASPLIINSFIKWINQTPNIFNVDLVAQSYRPTWESPLLSILYAVGYFGAISAVFAVLFAAIVKRRVRNEIV